jgi:tetratricopeptide (TPR) repeat protein
MSTISFGRLRSILVSTPPGAITLTVIPRGANSAASTPENASSAAFVPTYGEVYGGKREVRTVEMLMIRPLSLRWRAASCRTKKGPRMNPAMYALLAGACMEAGRLDDGFIVVSELLAAADEHSNPPSEPEAYRLRGELLLRQNESSAGDAQNCFERAIEIARTQNATSWELRATTSLARLLAKQDRRSEARALLATIYNWFTEGFDTPDLKDAKALLDELVT